jgi:hypothetical protein
MPTPAGIPLLRRFKDQDMMFARRSRHLWLDLAVAVTALVGFAPIARAQPPGANYYEPKVGHYMSLDP